MSDDPLLVDTSARAARYMRGIAHRRVAPAAAELAALRAFDEPWPTTSPARWQDRPAMRFSVSSWRTTERDIDDLAAHMGAVKTL